MQVSPPLLQNYSLCQWGKTCVAVGFLLMFEDLACWRQPGDIASPWLVQVLAGPGWCCGAPSWETGAQGQVLPVIESICWRALI